MRGLGGLWGALGECHAPSTLRARIQSKRDKHALVRLPESMEEPCIDNSYTHTWSLDIWIPSAGRRGGSCQPLNISRLVVVPSKESEGRMAGGAPPRARLAGSMAHALNLSMDSEVPSNWGGQGGGAYGGGGRSGKHERMIPLCDVNMAMPKKCQCYAGGTLSALGSHLSHVPSHVTWLPAALNSSIYAVWCSHLPWQLCGIRTYLGS